MSKELQKSRVMLIGITVISYIVVFGLVQICGLRVDYEAMLPGFGWLWVTLLLCSVYCSWRGMTVFRSIVEPLCFGVLLVLPTVLATYLAIWARMPLADAKLVAGDATLGFDWSAFIRFVDARPRLAHSLGFAYQSFAIQLLALPLILSVTGRPERAYRMVAAYALICLSSSVISVWFPALGTYAFYEWKQEHLANINAHFGYFFLEQFHAVRDNPDFIFAVGRAAGILTFPSVHAAAAVLCLWAAWGWKFARWPMLVVNVIMVVAAISHANHYFVDVVAGIMVASVCIAGVHIATDSARVSARRSVPVPA